MYRRRRRSQGTWMPVFGTEYDGEGNNNSSRQSTIITPVDDTIATQVFPLTSDFTPEQAEVTLLNDVVGQEWFLKRIVGKFTAIWTGSSGDFAPETVAYAKLALGFFVARSEDGGDINSNIPIGCSSSQFSSTTDLAATNSYSPLAQLTMREPWIFRRTWVLGKILATGPTLEDFVETPVPMSTIGFGSAVDGPHIDQKTKRRIRNDDRLWCAISAQNYNNAPLVGTLTYAYDLDIRLFGVMRKARNTGTF